MSAKKPAEPPLRRLLGEIIADFTLLRSTPGLADAIRARLAWSVPDKVPTTADVEHLRERTAEIAEHIADAESRLALHADDPPHLTAGGAWSRMDPEDVARALRLLAAWKMERDFYAPLIAEYDAVSAKARAEMERRFPFLKTMKEPKPAPKPAPLASHDLPMEEQERGLANEDASRVPPQRR